MRLITTAIILVLLLSGLNQVSGQITEIEILKNNLLSATADTSKVNILNKLSEKLYATEPKEVIKYTNEALNITGQISYKKGEALSLKFRGLAFYFLDEYLEAYKTWEAALMIYEELNNKKGIANTLSNLGAIYDSQGDYAQALDYYLRSLEMAKETSDTLREIAVLNNIGLIYSYNNDTKDLSLENYLSALELSESKDYTEGIGSASLNIGEYYFDQNDYSTAIEYFENALRAYNDINSKYITRAYSYIGKIYLAMEKYDVALKYQEEAYNVAQKNDDRIEMATSLLALGETYLIKGEYQKAIDLNEMSIKISTEIGTVKERMKAYKIQSLAYEKLNQFNKAYLNLLRTSQLKDTLFSEDSQTQLNKLRIQNELVNMKLENEYLKQENQINEIKNKQQSIVIFFLVLGFVVTAVFIILLFRTVTQKRKANKALEEQNVLISGQKQEITDSIRYASRIQKAVLTPLEDISKLLPDHFILYRPRDIVSGDFYWITEINKRIIFVVADCTGHGVPGAFMSMLGVAFLNEIISRNPAVQANELLNELRFHIIDSLHQKGEIGGSQDGMDISAIIIDKENSELQYAGANNPLFLFREEGLIEYKADKMPIGFHEKSGQPFTNHSIAYKKDDVIYAFSDGFPDQFGGPKGKKFMIKNFKETLMKIHKESMIAQKQELDKKLEDWMQNVDQIDDILVMGVRL